MEQDKAPKYDKPALDGAGRVCGWYDADGKYHSTWENFDRNDERDEFLYQMYGPNAY